jgi:Tat protein translocase TatB subunit
MFDFGFSEIVLTSAIALVVLGPERLPKVARQVGNWMGRARVMARQLTEQLEREVNAEELLKQRAKTAPPPQAAASYPDPLPPDHFPPDPAAPAAATPAVVPTPHPNSPQMMHARDQPPAPVSVPVVEPPQPANSLKPDHE